MIVNTGMSFLRYTPGAKPGVAPKRKAPEVTPPAEKRRAYERKPKVVLFEPVLDFSDHYIFGPVRYGKDQSPFYDSWTEGPPLQNP